MRRMLERLSKLRKKSKMVLTRDSRSTWDCEKAPMPGMKMVIDYLHYNLYQK